jgi:hypothetical protein
LLLAAAAIAPVARAAGMPIPMMMRRAILVVFICLSFGEFPVVSGAAHSP